MAEGILLSNSTPTSFSSTVRGGITRLASPKPPLPVGGVNWIIIGTDAHAKNYALLIGAEGRVRLAPLYDLASVFPYIQIDLQRVKLSMKLGGEYRFRDIQPRHWRKQAEELKVNANELIARVGVMAMQIAEAAPGIEQRVIQEGITHPLTHRLATRLVRRAAACRKLLRA